MIATPPSGSTALKAVAWAIRLIGVYILFGLPWCVWKAYSSAPLPTPPHGVSPQTFAVIVALVMTAVAILAFLMFLPIFRNQFLPMARDIERGEFGKKKNDDKKTDDKIG